jgi:hypothetical protein
VEKDKLKEITEAWQKETDEYVLKAVTKNLNEYPPEVRVIIREEAVKRGLIAYEITDADSDGLKFDVTITESGKDILVDADERRPKVVSIKLAKTIVIFFSICAVVGVVGVIFGLPEGILTAASGCVVYMAIEKIWSRR